MSSSDAITAVPPASLTDAGFVAPAETDILAGVQSDINAALGGSANQALNTPQGQLAVSETAIIGDCNDQLLALLNGFDPRNASGRMQDALGFIFQMARNPGESRADFETRRQNTIEANSNGTNASILGGILSLNDVNDAYVVDNPTDAAATIGGVSVPARSLFVSVSGGRPAEIGLVILQRKNLCSITTGSASVSVQDPASVYNGNGPTYTFNYTPATDTPVYVNVALANSAGIPSTALTSIQAAVITAFTGADGNGMARIGAELFASRYYAGVASLGAWARIVEITIGLSASPTAFTQQMTISQRPVISADTITLTLV